MCPKVSDIKQEDRSWSIPSLQGARYSQSLERGLAILGCFTPDQPVLGIADIAKNLGMSHSTVHRYAISLVALGFLKQSASYTYRLNLRVTNLGMSALNSTGLREHARPYLEELRRRCTYTTSLATLDGTEILYMARARSFRRGQNKIDLNLRIGSRLPAHCTSMGKVLLANLPEVVRRKTIRDMVLTRCGPNSITSKKILASELQGVSENGIAVNDQELASGLVSIACPLRCESQEVVAAINLAAHTSMISVEDLVDQLSPHLLFTADAVSARLGFRRGN